MRNLFSDSVWTGIFLAFSLVFGEGECRAEGAKPVRGQEIVVCNWNVENLFDTEDDPENKGDDGYTPRGWMHWTENRYRLKLEHLAEIIEAMKPDILCVEEIENRRVLEDLSNQLRKQKRHPMPYIVHRESSDKRGIDPTTRGRQRSQFQVTLNQPLGRRGGALSLRASRRSFRRVARSAGGCVPSGRAGRCGTSFRPSQYGLRRAVP